MIVFGHVELKNSRYFDFRYFSEFQSHEPEFDHLKSIEVHESIKSLAFVRNTGSHCLRLISTNEKVIKLWKVEERTYSKSNGTKISDN